MNENTLIAIMLAVGMVFAGPTLAQSVDTQISQVKDALEDAQAMHLDLICPKGFEKARKDLGEAEQTFSTGGNMDRIERNLATAREHLATCRSLEELGMVLVQDALQARDAALAANAPEYASQEWETAEKAMTQVGRRIEGGAGNKVSGDVDSTEQLYSDAELKAIRVNLLGNAKTAREQALDKKADRWAPVTLGKAADYLGKAEDILNTDRTRQGEAGRLAEAAENEFQHAAWIAERAEMIDKDRTEFEKIVLRYEERMSTLANQLGFEADFSDGGAPVIENMSAAVSGLKSDLQNLRAQVSELQAVAAKYEEVAPLEKINQKVSKISGMFAENEAEVSQSEQRLIVRLTALSFPTGSSEIQPKDFPVLTKVQSALREFPRSKVVIEGNTDSTGHPEFNQALSQRRAEAVREYLLANMNRGPETITTVGYGSSRPLASNETAEGRAKNRRIDVVIDLSSL
jgi:outer membrane protein OmpA-like peptidoglycan-associated protein